MFRGARRSDLEQILEIYAHARKAMADSGNPTQWGDSYPPQEMLEEDIDSNRLFVYTVNGCLEAVFAFILGPVSCLPLFCLPVCVSAWSLPSVPSVLNASPSLWWRPA